MKKTGSEVCFSPGHLSACSTNSTIVFGLLCRIYTQGSLYLNFSVIFSHHIVRVAVFSHSEDIFSAYAAHIRLVESLAIDISCCASWICGGF